MNIMATKQSHLTKKTFTFFLGIILIISMLSMFINPKLYVQATFDGLVLWFKNVFPTLFPYLVCTKIIIEMNLLEGFSKVLKPVMKTLFGLGDNSGYLFVLSLLSGYPVGSKIITDAYLKGQISYTELHRLISITTMSGPLFIVGSVGVNMLNNSKIGYIILLSHFISCIINGIIFRKYVPKYDYNIELRKPNKELSGNILTNAVNNAISSVLLVGGLIVSFYILITVINSTITLPPILQGVLEMTNGCNQLSILNCNQIITCVSISTIIAFGGLCIHSQCMSFLAQAKVKYRFFLMQKITYTIITFFVTYALALILL